METDAILNELNPKEGELPSVFAERLGAQYAKSVSQEHKKNNGQFFTPQQVGSFMASFNTIHKVSIKILDPGCGIGILSCAISEQIVNTCPTTRNIELIAFETDLEILPFAEKTLTYLRQWLGDRNINLTHYLCKNDFILHNAHILNDTSGQTEFYDIVIANPPYFKLPKSDLRAITAKAIIHGQSNIYSIFLVLAAKLLNESGQLIFITPRSFCSGNYFKLFREKFFSLIDFKDIHIFDSRTDAFRKDKVLQETIIIVATRKPSQINITNSGKGKELNGVRISVSNGVEDLACRRVKEYSLNEILDLNSSQKTLHLPSSKIDDSVMTVFESWENSLETYNIFVSTGPVVDFRNEDIIRFEDTRESVPLLWLHNIEAMNIKWPLKESKGKPKGQFIVSNENSSSKLVPNKNYVLLRRFSSKEATSRLVAAPYLSRRVPSAVAIGIENHLNYIYKGDGKNLTNPEAIGLAGLLNSTLFDIYFRTFNGNINVSATELRNLSFPDIDAIQFIGKKILRKSKVNKQEIDTLVSSVFNINADFTSI